MENNEPSLLGENLRQRRIHNHLRRRCQQKTRHAPPCSFPQTDGSYRIQNREVYGRYLPGSWHLGERETMRLTEVTPETEQISDVHQRAIAIENGKDFQVDGHHDHRLNASTLVHFFEILSAFAEQP